MIYRYEVDLDEWCKDKELQVITGKCGNCKTELKTIIPIETRNSYGLIAEKKCCDNPKPPYTFICKEDSISDCLLEILR